MKITPERCVNKDDIELIRLSLENLDYFSCLYQRYEAELLRYIKRISGIGHDESEDILQEAFIKIWRNLNEFNSDMKASSWIYRIVHNETVSHIRKKKSFGKDKTHDIELFRNILAEDQEIHLDTEERFDSVQKVLEKLPMKYKEVLVLKFLEKKSYIEISDILKIPEGTVAIRINRAKKIFRDYFESQD